MSYPTIEPIWVRKQLLALVETNQPVIVPIRVCETGSALSRRFVVEADSQLETRRTDAREADEIRARFGTPDFFLAGDDDPPRRLVFDYDGVRYVVSIWARCPASLATLVVYSTSEATKYSEDEDWARTPLSQRNPCKLGPLPLLASALDAEESA